MADTFKNGNGKGYATLVTLGGALLLGFNIAVSLFGNASLRERMAVLETEVRNVKELVKEHVRANP